VANKPYLFEYTFTLAGALTGKLIRFKLQASNEIGSTLSDDYLAAILAGTPTAPTSGPQSISDITSASQIGVLMPVVSTTGGSSLTSYHLMMDDGQSGNFESVSGGEGSLSMEREFVLVDNI